MSFKLVIVEDEQIELKELSMIINNEAKDIELVGVASDGTTGQQLIDELCPDIVISDIRLPGQTGLDMLSKVVPNVFSIIISGYSDFKYMQNAIRLGVEDYLLKPLDNQDLLQALSKITLKLKDRKEKQTDNIIQIPLIESVSNHLINNAIEFIKKNYQQQVGLQEAALSLNVSETHLSRLFKELVGINFLTYLNTYRINKSTDLLINTTLNINEIANKCGFITPGYFAKIFKRLLNTTPSKFRDNL